MGREKRVSSHRFLFNVYKLDAVYISRRRDVRCRERERQA